MEVRHPSMDHPSRHNCLAYLKITRQMLSRSVSQFDRSLSFQESNAARRVCFTVLVLVLRIACHQPVIAREPGAKIDYVADIVPILQRHCVQCHGPEKQEAGIRLDNLSQDFLSDRTVAEIWHEVFNVLNAAEMPPEDAIPLNDSELETLTGWLDNKIDQAIRFHRRDGGRVVMRRMTRDEYQNTMRDLLGIDMDYARDLPPESLSSAGFSNDSEALQLSSLQLEYYLANARRALNRAIVRGESPKVWNHRFRESNLDQWLGNHVRSNRLQRKQEFLATIKEDYPEKGGFLVRVTVNAELKPDSGFPLLEVSVGYRPDTELLLTAFDRVEVKSQAEQVFEFKGRLEEFPLPVRGQGKYPGLVIRVRNQYTDGSPLPEEKKDENKKRYYDAEPNLPTLVVHQVEFEGPIFEAWPPRYHRQILFQSELRETDESAYVAAVIKNFMQRAFRRNVTTAEVRRMCDFYLGVRSEFPSLEEAIQETLALILISPDFLYHVEPAGENKRCVTDWELASRLSFFLWNSMPDEQLFQLARQGRLQDPQILTGQVQRMLVDAKSKRFVNQFTDQWLRLETVDHVAINRNAYPDFRVELKEEMKKETRAFMQELIDKNLNLLNLLDSDFAMLNESMAKHYGIQGVYGSEFRHVSLRPEWNRGGLLGQASFLLSNSSGVDSHPIRRAVWILDRLLNDPPSPPPPDVPSLDEASSEFHKLSLREQLEIHRDRAACSRCHKNIDPWGIALEHYDAVGQYRDRITRVIDGENHHSEVIATESLPDGRIIRGKDALCDYLLRERREAFLHAFVTRIMGYALGRRIELGDQAAIKELVQNSRKNGYGTRDLVVSVATSALFATK